MKTHTYPATFETALRFTLEREGGYVNDSADLGGETNMGISSVWHEGESIAAMTHDRARQIYYQNYWQPCQCDSLPLSLAVLVFDTAVVMGQGDAVRYLQQSLGVSADGIIGPKTLAAANGMAPSSVIPDFLSRRVRHHHRMCVNRPEQERFFRGWVKRCQLLQQFVYTERLVIATE
ncbi:holin-associated N-acetylmuramidase [Kistimonas scapharcae]|uniref:Holin-associated N-acetylmuramidase n=1 Tax=Kistimonas scapharcae TaxID=1036133 RepID=A0ABP8V5M2_9GAMM